MGRNLVLAAIITLFLGISAQSAHASVAGGTYFAVDSACPSIGLVSFHLNGTMSSTMPCFTGTSYQEQSGIFLFVGGSGLNTGIGFSDPFGIFFGFADFEGVNVSSTFGIRVGFTPDPK